MERYELALTDEARADIRAAVRYLAVELRQPDPAETLLNSFDAALASLEQFPARCGLVHDPALAALGIRMAVVQRYLLFFLLDRSAHTVTVLRVLHGRRAWLSILSDAAPGWEL